MIKDLCSDQRLVFLLVSDQRLRPAGIAMTIDEEEQTIIKP